MCSGAERYRAARRRFHTVCVVICIALHCGVRCERTSTQDSVATRLRYGLICRYDLLLRPRTGSEYCDEFLCLSVCLSVRLHISETTRPPPNHQTSCVCRLWPWLDPPLAAMQYRYVMYFRFCGLHHVCLRQGKGDANRTYTQVSHHGQRRFDTAASIQSRGSTGLGAKFVIYDCTVYKFSADVKCKNRG